MVQLGRDFMGGNELSEDVGRGMKFIGAVVGGGIKPGGGGLTVLGDGAAVEGGNTLGAGI